MKTKDKDVPDLLGALTPKPRRGRPPKVKVEEPSKTAEQIAADLEKRGREYIEASRILRGKVPAQ